LLKGVCGFVAGQHVVDAAWGPGLRMNCGDKLSVSINVPLALHTLLEKGEFLKRRTRREGGWAVHALFLTLFPSAPTAESFWRQATE